ncbi:MAG: hypothetical protein PHH01_03990 [Patescibacteria group bacterium]|nr:hypothetical protein [Patescibacteria group bacterium]
MSKLLSISPMVQLGDALEAAGYTVDDVARLRDPSLLEKLRAYLRGEAEMVFTRPPIIKLDEHPGFKGGKQFPQGDAEVVVEQPVIDLDPKPFVPHSLTIVSHIKGGKFEWDPDKVVLHLSPRQRSEELIEGEELRRELEGLPVFNATLLDYLLAHPHLIPRKWRGLAIFFWGTIYSRLDGSLCVRGLHYHQGQWKECHIGLTSRWDEYCPAAMAA